MEKDISIPWIEIDVASLPSRGLAYPSGSKLRYRTYTFGEVKSATISNLSIITSLETTLKGIDTMGSPLSKDDLTVPDAIYLGILRKVSTTRGTQYEVPYVCSGCGKETKAVFTENSVEFQDVDHEILSFPIETEIQGKALKFSPLSVKNFLLLEKGRWNKDIKGGKPDRVSLHALMVTNMDFKEAYDLLYNLKDEDDISVIEEIDKLMIHDLSPIKTSCDLRDDDGIVCGTENEIRLEGREALIRPFRGGKGSIRSRIHLGAAQDS